MNDIITAIKERRSISKFEPNMTKHNDIAQITEAGLTANGRG